MRKWLMLFGVVIMAACGDGALEPIVPDEDVPEDTTVTEGVWLRVSADTIFVYEDLVDQVNLPSRIHPAGDPWGWDVNTSFNMSHRGNWYQLILRDQMLESVRDWESKCLRWTGRTPNGGWLQIQNIEDSSQDSVLVSDESGNIALGMNFIISSNKAQIALGCENAPSDDDTGSLSVSISGQDKVRVGQTIQLTSTVSGTTGNQSTAVLWRTGNSDIATINSDGIVTGVAVGSVSITAMVAVDTTVKISKTVTVEENTTDGLSVSISGSSLVQVNQQIQLTATVSGTTGNQSTAVLWRTSNNGVATVDSDGWVTGKSIGTVTITTKLAADTTVMSSKTITVEDNNASVCEGFLGCVYKMDTSLIISFPAAQIQSGNQLVNVTDDILYVRGDWNGWEKRNEHRAFRNEARNGFVFNLPEDMAKGTQTCLNLSTAGDQWLQWSHLLAGMNTTEKEQYFCYDSDSNSYAIRIHRTVDGVYGPGKLP